MAGAKVEEEVLLPGFCFHPTDEELVGFSFARQVDGRTPARIDHLIKHVDIYNYNPWDLTREESTTTSVRPIRVTGKRTKTDWMMHEFRLPPPDSKHDSSDPAEVLTMWRIFKRDVMQKRDASGWREPTTNNKLIQANQNQRQEYVAEMGSACYVSFVSLPSIPMAPDKETTSNNLDTDMMGRQPMRLVLQTTASLKSIMASRMMTGTSSAQL